MILALFRCMVLLTSVVGGTCFAHQDPFDTAQLLEICDTVYFFLESMPPSQHADFAGAVTNYYLNQSDVDALEFIAAVHRELPGVAHALQKHLLATSTDASYINTIARTIRRKLRANPAWYHHTLMLTTAHMWYQKNYRDSRFPLEIFAEIWMEAAEHSEPTQSWLRYCWDRTLEFLDRYKFIIIGLGIGGFFWMSHPRHSD